MNDSTEPTSSYSQPPAPLPAPVIEDKLVSPIVTYVLVALTVAIYLLQMGTNALFHVDLPAALGMKVNQYIMAGQLWRLLTPMFLHGSILHIGFNMYALVVIGSGLERRFGNWRFLLLYVLGSFGGNVFSFMLSPNPSLGASTSIFGLLGAQKGFFSFKLQGLGNGTDGSELINAAVFADIGKWVDHHMRADFCPVTDTDIFRNDGIGTDRHMVAKYSGRADNCGWMNHAMPPKVASSSASATSLSPTVAVADNLTAFNRFLMILTFRIN